jgi:hypothetical protein
MRPDIQNWIEQSLRDLFENDTSLIDRKLKEECINHRFAVYLGKNRPSQYSQYYVDLEYDKNAYNAKEIEVSGSRIRIRPDILIHRRMDDIADNLVAFECKKSYLSKNDKEKLRGLLGNSFNYQVCLGISYLPGDHDFLIYRQGNSFGRPKRCNKLDPIGSLA